MLTAHVERTPGASLSSTVNAALVEYLEAAALRAYAEWDAEADPAERAALDALNSHNDHSGRESETRQHPALPGR